MWIIRHCDYKEKNRWISYKFWHQIQATRKKKKLLHLGTKLFLLIYNVYFVSGFGDFI